MDDICDGGGTFVQLADVLLKHEAASVDLFVTHALLSKGREALHNIGTIYTTDSVLAENVTHNTIVFPFTMRDFGR